MTTPRLTFMLSSMGSEVLLGWMGIRCPVEFDLASRAG